MGKVKYFLIFVWGDVEPTVHGPFESMDERDEKALELRAENGRESGYFPAEVSDVGESNICMPESFGFSKFFDEKHAFYCHNVDFYWQALLTRELVVKYFNYLNSYLEREQIYGGN